MIYSVLWLVTPWSRFHNVTEHLLKGVNQLSYNDGPKENSPPSPLISHLLHGKSGMILCSDEVDLSDAKLSESTTSQVSVLRGKPFRVIIACPKHVARAHAANIYKASFLWSIALTSFPSFVPSRRLQCFQVCALVIPLVLGLLNDVTIRLSCYGHVQWVLVVYVA